MRLFDSHLSRRLPWAAALAIAASAPVFAADDEPVQLQEVIVTGSRIRTTDQGALPVQTVTAEQIQQSGAANPEQFLQLFALGCENSASSERSSCSFGGLLRMRSTCGGISFCSAISSTACIRASPCF